MNRLRKQWGIGLVSAVMAALFVWPAPAQQTSPQTNLPPGQIQMEIGRSLFPLFAVLGDGDPASGSMPWAMTSGKIFRSAESRRLAGAKAMPAINRLLVLFDQAEPIASETEKEANRQLSTLLSILKVALGDAKAREPLEKAAGRGGENAALARLILAAADYLIAGQDPAGQRRAIQNLIGAYKKVPPEAPLLHVPEIFTKNPPAAEVLDQLIPFLRADTHSRLSDNIADALDRHFRAAAILNQPLAVQNTLLDGSNFSTAKWKGSVVLVNFWHSQCAPCIAEMADIKRLYSIYHARGLEVVGYDCDETASAANAFLAKNPQYNWPQIFDAAHPGASAAMQSFGLEGGTPTTFLIDRKGVLRKAISGSDKNLGQEIARLVAETP